ALSHLSTPLPRPPRCTLFPYTTLFRSERGVHRNPFGGLAQKPHDVAGRVGTPPAQMAEEQLPFLRPKCEQGMVADLTIVGLSRRSEEHTSELQSRFDLVCRLLLEKKNK